jgi:FkbH-like protein
MQNSSKTEDTTTRHSRESHADEEETARSYVRVFLNHLVQKFRQYNSDEFTVCIAGVGGFVQEKDVILRHLLEQLRQRKFDIVIRGENDHLDHIDVDYENATSKQTCHLSYRIQDVVSTAALSATTGIPLMGIFIMRIVAQIVVRSKTLYKAIVLDLDGTLWPGTLSEIGLDGIQKNLSGDQGLPFIAFMKFCRALATELGVFIAICSRNDSGEVNDAIQKLLPESIFPLKNQVDCLVANDNDKSENITRIADELSILPDAIVFIDDNQIVRDEVKTALPRVFVPEWSSHNELSTQLVAGCLFERAELSLNARNRRRQYRIIRTERSQSSLPELSIRVHNDGDHIEARALYAKSNQFKISGNNDNFDADAESLYFEIYRANGENLGICSAITYTASGGDVAVINWAISCRYFQIGVEEFVLLRLSEIAKGGRALINYQESEHNLKVKEVLERYCRGNKKNGKAIDFLIEFTEYTINRLRDSTNLKDIGQ